VLAYERQIGSLTWLLSGGLIGAVLVHLASPILAIDASPLVRLRGIGLWLISAVTALLTVYPRALLLPFFDNKETYAAAVAILIPLLLIGFLVTQVHLLTTTVAIGREVIHAWRSPHTFALTAAVSSIGLASALAVLLPTNRFAWTTPPMSLPASALGVLILVGASVPLARALVAPRTSQVGGNTFSQLTGRRFLLAPLVLGVALWAWQADRQFPEGLWEPTITVESDASGVGDSTLPNDVLRTTLTRTGLRGTGERFVVRYGKDIVEEPFNARTRYLPDGRILIMLNSGLPADRQRNFLAYQFANDLIRLRFLGVEEVVAHGYAYWAANNNQNPFVVGISSGAASAVACEASAHMRYESGEIFYSPLASLPFLAAEHRSGVAAAQGLLLEMVDTGEDIEDVRARVAAGCATVLSGYVAPDELVIQAPSNRPDLVDPTIPRAALAEAKTRSGLDALGAQFVVRYATPRGGLRGDMDFSDPGRPIITLIPSMSVEERRASLITYFVGTFVTLYFGEDVEPVRSGFASWVARDPTNPFVVSRSGNLTAQGACDYLPQADFKTARSVGATWLSSLPFILAERSGGDAAARVLIVELFDQGPIDREEWRGRIRADCGRFLGTAR